MNRDIPFNGLHWFFDHAETITERNIERVSARRRYRGAAPNGFQGEYFVDRYGKDAVKHTPPPVAKMLELDVPVGLGTDATRVASYNRGPRSTGWSPGVPWAAWRCMTRVTVCRARWRWNCGPQAAPGSPVNRAKKGRIEKDQLADLVVLSKDYFSVPEEEIKGIESVLTVVDGKVVYAAGHFSPLAPPPIPVLPEWSPVVRCRATIVPLRLRRRKSGR